MQHQCIHKCDTFQKGIREIFLSFQGGLSKMYRLYRKILNSDAGGFEVLVKSGMFLKKKFYGTFQGASPEGQGGFTYTVIILSFQTDMPRQTVQTQISLIRVYTVCHSVSIVWTHYYMVEPHSSNFRVITTNVFGVRIFRKFTVCV